MKSRMRRLLVLITVLLLVLSMGGAAAGPPTGEAAKKVKVLVGFKGQPGPAEQALVHGVGGDIKYTYHLVPAIAATVPETAIEALQRSPTVIRVEPDLKVYATDDELDNTWGVKRIGAGTVHEGGNKGRSVKVAIIDSGIDYTHPDLKGNYAGGYDFVNSDDYPMDDDGHGTHVAGTVAAEDNGKGVVGVAPEADLYALKVLGSDGSGDYRDVIAALEWAVEEEIQVTNNSYGSSGDPGDTVKAAFDNAYEEGVLNVSSAGNSGNRGGGGDNVSYPARYDSCIAVAATDTNDNRAKWSSTGPDVELAAPGVDIKSTQLAGGYVKYSGTSMASPHVAGTAALVIAANPGWDNDQVRTQLQNTADYLGDPNHYGYGLVNAAEAVGASGDEDNPPTVNITAPSEDETISGNVTIKADASDDDAVTQVEFFVDGSSIGVDSDDSDGWSASWDTTVYDDGSHTVSATATDTIDQTTSDSVSVTVDNGGGGETGGMYVGEISWREIGPHLKATVTILVDSDGDGVAESSDDPVSDANVGFTLSLDSDGDETYDDGSQSYSGTTDSAGQVEFMWKRAPSGEYEGEVTDLTHTSYDWNSELDADNPDYYPE